MVLQCVGLRKTFHPGLGRAPKQAVIDISFQVEAAEIFGFLGPNGAGKTTTIKVLLGLIRPDGGEVKILGHSPRSKDWRARVGYMPEHPNFYDFLSGFEMVTWFGRLSGMARHDAETEAKRLLGMVGLNHALNNRIRSYSKGMLQRAGLAAALVGGPALLILDEPMTGLDPIGRKEIREILLELRHQGKTIFYSTHILPDVEMTCDRVSIIDQGRTKHTGSLSEILTNTLRGVSVQITRLSPELKAKLVAENPQAVLRDEVLLLEHKDIDAARAFVSQTLAQGAQLVAFEPHKDDLESIFIRSLDQHVERRS
jgi:ABC-2 type transport system ATP-binding protein